MYDVNLAGEDFWDHKAQIWFLTEEKMDNGWFLPCQRMTDMFCRFFLLQILEGLGWILKYYFWLWGTFYSLFPGLAWASASSAVQCHSVLHCAVVPLRSLQRWPAHSHVSFWRRWAPDGPLLCLRPAQEPDNTISHDKHLGILLSPIKKSFYDCRRDKKHKAPVWRRGYLDFLRPNGSFWRCM